MVGERRRTAYRAVQATAGVVALLGMFAAATVDPHRHAEVATTGGRLSAAPTITLGGDPVTTTTSADAVVTTAPPPSPPATTQPAATARRTVAPTTAPPPVRLPAQVASQTWPAGSIPPPWTERPYTRTVDYAGINDLTVWAPADGGRPGETIDVDVEVTWTGLWSGGYAIVRGPLRYDVTPDVPQQTVVIESTRWTDPCFAPPRMSRPPVTRTGRFSVLLGPGNGQYNYEVIVYRTTCEGSDTAGEYQVGAYLQLTFWSWVATPAVPPASLGGTG